MNNEESTGGSQQSNFSEDIPNLDELREYLFKRLALYHNSRYLEVLEKYDSANHQLLPALYLLYKELFDLSQLIKVSPELALMALAVEP